MKAALAALALTALFALVALAARGSHPGGHGRIAQRRVPDQVNNDLLTIIIILYVAGVIALLVAFVLFRGKWEPVKSHWLRDLLIVLVAFSLIAAIGHRLLGSKALHRKAEQQAAAQRRAVHGKSNQAKPRDLTRVNADAHFDWPLAIGLLGLLVVGGAVYYVRARANPMPPGLVLRDDVANELSAAVSEAIDDLRQEPDPRRAVIAAYARMEGVLARHGQARDPAETPFEYVSRILLGLRVRGGAVRELTELFECAKFSTHEIDEAMKERAISSLLSVRDDLRPAVAAA
jgi:hypothetical protein